MVANDVLQPASFTDMQTNLIMQVGGVASGGNAGWAPFATATGALDPCVCDLGYLPIYFTNGGCLGGAGCLIPADHEGREPSKLAELAATRGVALHAQAPSLAACWTAPPATSTTPCPQQPTPPTAPPSPPAALPARSARPAAPPPAPTATSGAPGGCCPLRLQGHRNQARGDHVLLHLLQVPVPDRQLVGPGCHPNHRQRVPMHPLRRQRHHLCCRRHRLLSVR